MEKREKKEEIIASEFRERQQLEVKMEKQIMGSSDCDFGEKSKVIDPAIRGDEDLQQIALDPSEIHGVAIGKQPFEQNPKIGGKSVGECVDEEGLGQAIPCSGISGMKRKAEKLVPTDEETASVASKESQKKKWYCSLCDVSATSAGGWNLHIHGKKHKAKEASLTFSKTANNISTVSYSADDSSQPKKEAKAQTQPMEEHTVQVKPIDDKNVQVQLMEERKVQVHLIEEEKAEVHLMEEEKAEVQPMEEQKAQAQPMVEPKAQVQPMVELKDQLQPMEEDTILAEPEEKEKTEVRKKWECSLCQVSATSEILLRSHLQGRKHKSKEAQLRISQGINEVKGKNEVSHKWFCSLCNVSAASEKNLNAHMKGKKHKVKAGLLNEEDDNVDSKGMEGVKGLGNEQEKVNTLNSVQTGIGGSTNNEEGKKCKENVETEELEEMGIGVIRELVKVWLCKTCNEETKDEEEMANHRKSSKHMNKLRQKGGGVIVVTSMMKEVLKGEKDPQSEALECK